ncbi:pao retrotransposon peptidase domain-containing protein [Phthorimaea operculella]|nr:pao retrotransposon peptidase domain-containing protein [Phthorimaea operculella]
MSEDANNLSVLMHKRSCIDTELDTVVQLGIEASSNEDSYRKFMVSCMELPRIQDQFESIQTAIEGLEMKEKQTLSKDHVEIRSAFNDLIREIKSIKFEFELQKEEAVERARKEEAKAAHESTLKNQEEKAIAPVQLPKLSVPPFSGDFRQWKPFSEIFVSLIDNDKRLSDVAKFQYLLSYVRGDASKLLRGLPVTGSNYKKAWGILEYNFNNERLIAMQHMDSLYKLPSLNVASASGLRTILTGFLENMGALESMGFPIDEWDFMLYYLLYRKIDPTTRRDFDKSITTNRVPKFHELREFLDREIISWESSRSFQGLTKTSTLTMFKKKNPYDRFIFAKDNRLCLRCLKPMHDSTDTQCALIRCSICSASHHCALLHFAKDKKQDEGVKEESGSDSHGSGEGTSSNIVSLCAGKDEPERKFMLHYTAVVLIRDSLGNFHKARALVDPGSDSSFITESLVSRLGLPRRKSATPIHGIGDVMTRSRGVVSTVIKSHVGSGPEFHFEGLVMGHITSDKPRLPLETDSWSFLSHLVLADPTFHTPSPVEILIGGEIYEEILLGKKIRGPPGTPAAVSTSLGWLIIGKVDNKFVRNGDMSPPYSSFHISSSSIEERLDQSIRRFWEIESVPEKPILSPEDQRCEEIFVKTHRRLDSGRYVVSLPFRDGEPSLGESRHLAMARLRSVERRFVRDDKFRQMYTDFMDDYLESDHMELVTEEIKGNHCYIAHSGVLRPSSTTTQCRTVFDAAAATSDGTSLNDTQLNYQLILWRKTLDQEPQTFRLKTVTYGLSSSPFLAIRVLQQLAHDHQSEFPEAAEVLRRFTYMDDVVSGSDSIDSAVNLQRQLIGLLQKGCFDLRKWCSNSPEFLDRLPDSTKNIDSATVSLDEDGSVKILGLAWNPHKDVFSYSVRPLNDQVTKRVILSETARIFDPLGFLCPVIISAKILFQELWLAGVDWDAEVPDAIRQKWLCLAKEFPDLSKIQICRFVPTKGCRVQLHGFCDSSEVAFAAVVYFRVVHPDNTVSVHILTGKSRVAPKEMLVRSRYSKSESQEALLNWSPAS